MSKLLVTGAAGFIGANFIHYWHRANPTTHSSHLIV
jgi:dTDP-D-glucose 4,6-dehydratase